MIWGSRYSSAINIKVGQHRRFWEGSGPSLLFIPAREQELYDLDGYVERFRDPAKMFEFERARALEVADWPTDGIPTVRPSLGTVLVPGSVGQEYELREGAMPWTGAPLSRDDIRGLEPDIANADLMKNALDFYRLAAVEPDMYAYHGDTQGVFDIAYLIYGTEIFTDMTNEQGRLWVTELMDRALEWYLECTRLFKRATGEPVGEMVHGHGTPQGLYFPNAGARLSEDTATLLSPQMIEGDLLPYMERSALPFERAFVHFCGKHDFLFKMLCEQPWCIAVDLGNPEMYDLAALLDICAKTDTVFHSRVAPIIGEGWREYVQRIGRVVRDSGARCVLRATVFPGPRPDAVEMLERFHELTMRA